MRLKCARLNVDAVVGNHINHVDTDDRKDPRPVTDPTRVVDEMIDRHNWPKARHLRQVLAIVVRECQHPLVDERLIASPPFDSAIAGFHRQAALGCRSPAP